MQKLPEKLQEKLSERANDNALRSLSTLEGLIDFSSNDYLGFSKSELIFKAASDFLSQRNILQNGATGSRLLSGNHIVYAELEEMLVKFHKSESALVFNSGYDANIGFFSSVPQRGDVIFYDEYIHASIRDGIKMGNAKSYKFRHNDLADVKNSVERFRSNPSYKNDQSEIYIVTESVFSMDGDSPNLKAFADFCAENNCRLIVDEAHALGVFGKNGRGLVQEMGIEDRVFARIITFGKAIGCHGAAILGTTALKNYLVNFARSLIYTTAMSPHAVATILVAYQHLNSLHGSTQQQMLQENIDYFKEKLESLSLKNHFISSDSAIHCCVVQGNDSTKYIAGQLHEKGYDVKPILSPTVPEGEERLRFCLHSYTTKDTIEAILELLATYL